MSGDAPTVIIDASVAIKFVVEEQDSDRALALALRHTLLVPAIFWTECANILFKKVKTGELPADAAPAAWSGLRQFGITTARQTREMDDDMFVLSSQLRHPAYDCAYLALARATGLPFHSADKRLLALLGRARVTGIDAHALSAFDARPT